jgi:hypothetical protein
VATIEKKLARQGHGPVRRLLARMRGLHEDERGVMSVIAAFSMLALIGMLALVVDLGYTYGQRRLAQNVADSGAMAGTKVIARHRQFSDQTDSGVLAAIKDVSRKSSGLFTPQMTGVYVGADGAPFSPSVQVGSLGASPPPAAARGVRLAPSKSFPSMFAGVLGTSTLSTGATATAVTKAVTGLAPGLYAPYAIWGGEDGHNCLSGNAYSGGCIDENAIVNYRCNNYESCNVHTGDERWLVTSNTFKGYLHLSGGFLVVNGESSSDLQGGNSVGTAGEPLDALSDCYIKRGDPYYCTVVIPIIDTASDDGTNIRLRVVGFANVSLTNNPATLPPSQPWEGRIVGGSIVYSGGGVSTDGPEPLPGVPSIQYVRLTQ